MINPTYEGDFQSDPWPERIATMQFVPYGETAPQSPLPTKMISTGIKTVTHSRAGVELMPHKVVALEMTEADDVGSLDLSASHARVLGEKLIEFADYLDRGNGHGRS